MKISLHTKLHQVPLSKESEVKTYHVSRKNSDES